MPLLGVATIYSEVLDPTLLFIGCTRGEWPASLPSRNQISPTPLWSRAWRVT